VRTEVNVSDLRKKTASELELRAIELKHEIFACRSAGVGSEEKKQSHKKRNCRKELARILTITREREIIEVPSEPLL
jgi:ribosomal protein L29